MEKGERPENRTESASDSRSIASLLAVCNSWGLRLAPNRRQREILPRVDTTRRASYARSELPSKGAPSLPEGSGTDGQGHPNQTRLVGAPGGAAARPGRRAGGPGGLVLRRLGWDRLPGAAVPRVPRSHLPGRILRHNRDQHVVLPAPPAKPLRAMVDTRGGEPAVSVHRETLAEIHARKRSHRGRRARCPGGI